jgi:hypothetical protein
VSASGVAAAVAMAESSGNSNAINHNSNGSTDYGLWQINSVHSGQFGTPGSRWLDPVYNAQMAHTLWKSQGFRPWVTYNNGAYKKYNSGSSATGMVPTSVSNGAVTVQNAGFNDFLQNLGGSLLNGPAGHPDKHGNIVPGPEQDPGQILSGATSSAIGKATGLDKIAAVFGAIGQVFALMLTPSFWLRLGIGIMGVAIVIAAIILMAESNKTVRSTTIKAGKVAALA